MEQLELINKIIKQLENSQEIQKEQAKVINQLINLVDLMSKRIERLEDAPDLRSKDD